jgi:3D (Asp-Asp-Asp) domain-containing protein
MIKKIIILIQIITILILENLMNKIDSAPKPQEFYYMTSTAYTIHPKCTPNNKGITTTGTLVREGIVAINVDWIDEEWQVRSPLKLGQKIYIEEMGPYFVEDTGYFTEENLHFDFWNLDIYKEDYDEAKEWGIKRIKVYVLGE